VPAILYRFVIQKADNILPVIDKQGRLVFQKEKLVAFYTQNINTI